MDGVMTRFCVVPISLSVFVSLASIVFTYTCPFALRLFAAQSSSSIMAGDALPAKKVMAAIKGEIKGGAGHHTTHS